MKIFIFLSILIVSLFSYESYNKIDDKYKITTEQELKSIYKTKISPYFYSKKLHYFDTNDSLKIAYKIFKVSKAKGTIVISSGRTEGMVKYQELIYDLTQNRYNVYILDHRGQGYSSRLLKNTQIGHVKDYNNYINDLDYFVKHIVKKDKKMILLGHSMGGAIASVYIERFSGDFDALILSSPMNKPEIISEILSDLGCKIMVNRKRDIDRYIYTEHSYDDKTSFEENILTHSRLRYKIADEAYEKEPSTKVGGASVRWLAEACKMANESVSNANKIDIPVLLLQAEDDKVVSKEAQDEFCNKIKNNCKAYQLDKAYHELFIEKDDIRLKTLNAILEFISKV
jgi:lysophospholipase